VVQVYQNKKEAEAEAEAAPRLVALTKNHLSAGTLYNEASASGAKYRAFGKTYYNQ
jgi:hypothetical protein